MFCSVAWAQTPAVPPAAAVVPAATLGQPLAPSPAQGMVPAISSPGSTAIVTQVPAAPQMPPTATPGGSLPEAPAGTGQPSDGSAGATEPGTEFSAEARPEQSEESPLGPTPLNKVQILQKLLFGDNADKAKIQVSGWMDFDYTFRSTGPGVNNVAPVMNRFGDEFLARTLGLYITKPLDPKELSWGFNAIFIAGADAAFLTPLAGGWTNSNPRFGTSFTDLNVTAHLPILTEGGVDVKAGRQTTVLGPMGALPWQRYFDSSDYAWFNMEEGRYTGVSSVWHITKQLDWYNCFEVGGWGVFYDNPVRGVDYITQISYWLDSEAKKTKVWLTVLTGPTSFTPGQHGLNTTVTEVGIQHNWNKYWYQIIDSQIVYSKGPVFGAIAPSYQQRAYDVYTYIGRHLNKCWDINGRFEWYYDVDGGRYPGGFGQPHTSYIEVTVGPDYHPTPWLQVRPEIRYDNASHPNFGENRDMRHQLSLAIEALIKF